MTLFSDYTFRIVALGSSLLGLISGLLGSFAFLRRQSLLGDAISHAALPGIALAYLFTRNKSPLVLLIGAAIAGWLASISVTHIARHSRVKYDAALGLILSVFFGIGLMILTFLQKQPDSGQAGLDRFLFGQASAMSAADVMTISVIGGVSLIVLFFFWKEIKVFIFDEGFSGVIGFSPKKIDSILTFLIVIAVAIGLQIAGVVLMSAMLVGPAAAARQWTNSLKSMVLLAGLLGMLSGFVGATASSLMPRLPTGPAIVVCLSIMVAFSLLFAADRGLVWNMFRKWRNRESLRRETILIDLLEMAGSHDSIEHSHSIAALKLMYPDIRGLRGILAKLEKEGYVLKKGSSEWALTPSGSRKAAAFAERLEAKS